MTGDMGYLVGAVFAMVTLATWSLVGINAKLDEMNERMKR